MKIHEYIKKNYIDVIEKYYLERDLLMVLDLTEEQWEKTFKICEREEKKNAMS